MGKNYLDVCEFAEGDNSIEACAALKGIQRIMTNQQDEWSLVYPCHSPAEQRWFLEYVCRYEDNASCRTAVYHLNITDRKLAEKKLLNFNDTLKLRAEERTPDFETTIDQLKPETKKRRRWKDPNTTCSSKKAEGF